MSKLWPPRRYKKAWCPYLNHGIQANEVTRNKLIPRSVAIRWVFQYRHSYQLHGPTNCSVIPTEGTAETTSIGTMARRNFYHTAGFWNNNSNNNNFCARTVKEFLANFLTQPSAPSPFLLASFSFSLKIRLIPPAGQWCRFIVSKNTSDPQLLQDCSSPKTSAASTYQQLPQ